MQGNKMSLIVLVACLAAVAIARTPCDPVSMSKGTVCRCTASYCDDFEVPPSFTSNQVVVYTSSESGKRLDMEVIELQSSLGAPLGSMTLQLDGSQHQKILGFGGAFTDAAAYVVSFLPQAAQDYFYKSYFSRNGGARYSFGRVPVGSADFSRTSYSLVDDNDLTMSSFALKDDNLIPGHDAKLDMILRAQQEIADTTTASDPASIKSLNVFSSIWSAPVWMKTCNSPPAPSSTNNCDAPTFLLGALKTDPTIRQAYAEYWASFIREYANHGVVLWGITAQNEPDGNPTGNKWENTYFTAEDLADLVNNYIGPTLKAEFPNLKIMNGDDQYPRMPEHAAEMASSPYIDGLAYHWYYSFAGSLINTGPVLIVTDLIGGQVEVRNAYNNYDLKNRDGKKFMLMTEACTGYLDNVVEPGSWERGYNYMTSILHELEAGSSGWVDWNLALDMSGGPNHAGNEVDAPILVDTSLGVFYKQPMYYTMAHFSAFVPPGSIRLGLKNSDIGFHGWFRDVEAVAFKTANDECAMVVANDHLTASLPVRGTSANEVLHIVTPNGKKKNIPIYDNEFKTILFKCSGALASSVDEGVGADSEPSPAVLSSGQVGKISAGIVSLALLSTAVVIGVMKFAPLRRKEGDIQQAVVVEEKEPSL